MRSSLRSSARSPVRRSPPRGTPSPRRWNDFLSVRDLDADEPASPDAMLEERQRAARLESSYLETKAGYFAKLREKQDLEERHRRHEQQKQRKSPPKERISYHRSGHAPPAAQAQAGPDQSAMAAQMAAERARQVVGSMHRRPVPEMAPQPAESSWGPSSVGPPSMGSGSMGAPPPPLQQQQQYAMQVPMMVPQTQTQTPMQMQMQPLAQTHPQMQMPHHEQQVYRQYVPDSAEVDKEIDELIADDGDASEFLRQIKKHRYEETARLIQETRHKLHNYRRQLDSVPAETGSTHRVRFHSPPTVSDASIDALAARRSRRAPPRLTGAGDSPLRRSSRSQSPSRRRIALEMSVRSRSPSPKRALSLSSPKSTEVAMQALEDRIHRMRIAAGGL